MDRGEARIWIALGLVDASYNGKRSCGKMWWQRRRFLLYRKVASFKLLQRFLAVRWVALVEVGEDIVGREWWL